MDGGFAATLTCMEVEGLGDDSVVEEPGHVQCVVQEEIISAHTAAIILMLFLLDVTIS